MSNKMYNNIVPEAVVRDVQKKTLDIIASAVANSFGPKGSTTAIVKNTDSEGANIEVEHTKDGHTIVKNLRFLYPIERSVQDLLTELTRYVVKEVGDGTSSAVILCKTVFDALCEDTLLANLPPADVLHKISSVIEVVNSRILSKAKECTLDDIYKIALISTNNNEDVSRMIQQMYAHYGLDVYIDVGISTQTENIVKEYDGMTLETGFADMCMVNMKETNSAVLENPNIYCFNDPIDTPEMLGLLNAIIDNNILRCYKPNSMYEPIPTVVFCKKLSPDSSSYFETVVKLMNQIPGIPLLIVSDIHQDYLYEDIANMCGAKFIKKYINPDIQKQDIEAGLAPTKETIVDFCGHAARVESDQLKTKIINPAKMFDENGNKSEEYKAMLKYLENQVQKCIDEDAGITATSEAKRRLNSLKGNMIDFLIGGVTISDREALKSSVEDAVLNCRSAAVNGVGFGANYMAYKTLYEMSTEEEYLNNVIVNILLSAYRNLIKILYSKSFDVFEVDLIIENSLRYDCPLNIRNNEYDYGVLSSIKSDIVVLETINKILALMFTTNQYLVPSPAHNIYLDYKLDDADDALNK